MYVQFDCLISVCAVILISHPYFTWIVCIYSKHCFVIKYLLFYSKHIPKHNNLSRIELLLLYDDDEVIEVKLWYTSDNRFVYIINSLFVI